MTREEVSRNALLWGDENQEALQQFSVGIVGTTKSAQLLAVSLLSLGVGKVVLIDNSRAARKARDFLIPTMSKGDSKVKTFASALNTLFPHSETIGYHTPPVEAVLYRGLPQLLFDLSGSTSSAARTTALGRMYHRPTYIGTHTADSMSISRISQHCNPHAKTPTTSLSRFTDDNAPLAGMVAALCAEEARKHAFSMDKADRPVPKGQSLTLAIKGEKEASKRRTKRPRILLAGAGALGNFLALYLAAEMECALDIYDGDTVEASNLNRQFLFRQAEGRPKAETLASRLKDIASEAEINGINAMIDKPLLDTLDKNYDLVLSCVDNIETRLLLSTYAAEHGIPLLNGGTSSLGGTMQMYLPGRTPTISQQAGLEALLDEEKGKRQQRGCALANPSVIMPNAAIGGLMAHYARKILDGTATPCTAKYHSFAETRVYFPNRQPPAPLDAGGL